MRQMILLQEIVHCSCGAVQGSRNPGVMSTGRFADYVELAVCRRTLEKRVQILELAGAKKRKGAGCEWIFIPVEGMMGYVCLFECGVVDITMQPGKILQEKLKEFLLATRRRVLDKWRDTRGILSPCIGAKEDGRLIFAVVMVVRWVHTRSERHVGVRYTATIDPAGLDPPRIFEFDGYLTRVIVIKSANCIFLRGMKIQFPEVHTLQIGQCSRNENRSIRSGLFLPNDLDIHDGNILLGLAESSIGNTFTCLNRTVCCSIHFIDQNLGTTISTIQMDASFGLRSLGA